MSILGIDIGSRSIKVVEAKVGAHHAPVQAYMIETPRGRSRTGKSRMSPRLPAS